MTETTSANPELLADQVSSILVQPLEAASIVLSSGVRVFDTSAQLRVPKLASGATVGFVAEGAQIPDTGDVGFDELVLMPSTRTSLKIILRYTRELVRQSVIGIDSVLKQRLVTDVSNALDTALLSGTGAANSITGILAQVGTQPVVWDKALPDTMLDAIDLAYAAEVTPNRWFINGSDWIELRKLKEATGSNKYLFEGDIHAGETLRLFGIPVTVSNKVPAGKFILADTSQIAVARDVAPSVTVLNERYAEFDEVGLRVTARYDLGLLHPEAVIIGTDAP
ncbi:phage major capsid protein [Mycobacterium sp. DBP42]|uniref:phage major capsid protein n=1 Tax=Mycobacterium sp. DBP42 TaxID=2545267 RepID=UPI00352F659A